MAVTADDSFFISCVSDSLKEVGGESWFGLCVAGVHSEPGLE